MRLIYIHGFNSAYDPESTKIEALSKTFIMNGITYDTFGHPEDILDEIADQIRMPIQTEEVALIGTSLGGYWASELGFRFKIPSILINPCVSPQVSLQKYVGVELTNYQTFEVKTLSQRAVNSYSSLITNHQLYSFVPLVLLDMGDEVIDACQTQRQLSKFVVRCWKGGSHRFDHIEEAIIDIQRYLNHCSYVSDMNAN